MKKIIGIITLGTVITTSFMFPQLSNASMLPQAVHINHNNAVALTQTVDHPIPTLYDAAEKYIPLNVYDKNGNILKHTSTKNPTILDLDISIDGNSLDLNKTPVYMNKQGRTMIPLRSIMESLGYEVAWKPSVTEIQIQKNNMQLGGIKLYEDQYYHKTKMYVQLGAEPEHKSGTTYVPIEYLTQVLKLDVQSEAGMINIHTTQTKSYIEVADAMLYKGKVAEITQTEDGLQFLINKLPGMEDFNESILFHAKEETKFNVEKASIKEGDFVDIFYSGILTRSIPPQGVALAVNVVECEKPSNPLEQTFEYQGTIKEIMDGKNRKLVSVISKNNTNMNEIIFHVNEKTQFVQGNNNDLKKDAKVNVTYGPVMTSSLPPQTTALIIEFQK